MDPLVTRTALTVLLHQDLNKRARGEPPSLTGKESVHLDLAIGSRAGRYLGFAARLDQIAMQASDDVEFDALVDASQRSEFLDLREILKKTTGWRRYKALDRGGHLAGASVADVADWLHETALGRWYAVRDNGLVRQMDTAFLKALPDFVFKRLLEDGFDLSPHLDAFDDICRLLDDLNYVIGIMGEYPRAFLSYDTLDSVARSAMEDGYPDAWEELLQVQRDNGHPPPSLEWLSASAFQDRMALWDALAEYGYQWDVDVPWIHEHFFDPRKGSAWDDIEWIWYRFDNPATVRALSMACMGAADSVFNIMSIAKRGPMNSVEVQLLVAKLPADLAIEAIMDGGRIDDVSLEWIAANVKLDCYSFRTTMGVISAHKAWKDIDPDWVLRHLDARVAIEVFDMKGWYDRYTVQDLHTMFKTSAYAAFKKSGWLLGIPLDELAQLAREEDVVDAMICLGQVTLDSIDTYIRDGDLVYKALQAANMLHQVTPEWMRARMQGNTLLKALAHGGHVADMSDGELCRAYLRCANPGDMPGVSERVRSLSVARLYTCLGGKRDVLTLGRALEMGEHLQHCDPDILGIHGDRTDLHEIFAYASVPPHRMPRFGMRYS